MTTPGTTYGGRYTLTQRIAVGGMGEVWQATDNVLGRTVAIKLLGAGLANQPGFTHRFRDEARHTAALSHPNIATVYDYGEDDGASWLVMELVHGTPLSAIISQGAQSPQRTAAIIAQAADALQAAHDAGVIHRDVKPANILVRPDGVVKLTDFGIARAVDAAPLTRTGEVMGTAQYIPPEQAMGHPVGPASDLYSLACVAHEMLTGRRAFDDGSAVATAMAHVHKPPPGLPPSVPAGMASVIMASLAKDPANRPRSARDVASALRGGPAPQPRYDATSVLPPPVAATQAMTSPTAYAQAGIPGAYGQTGPQGGIPGGYGQTGPQPYQRRRNPAIWIIPLVIVLLLAGAWAINKALNGTPTSTPTTSAPVTRTSVPSSAPSSSTMTTPATVTVDAEAIQKLTVAQAVERLGKLGVRPVVNPVVSSEPRGKILSLSQSGVLLKGDVVTLTVSDGSLFTTAPPVTPTDQPTTETPNNPGPSVQPSLPDKKTATNGAGQPGPGHDVGHGVGHQRAGLVEIADG